MKQIWRGMLTYQKFEKVQIRMKEIDALSELPVRVSHGLKPFSIRSSRTLFSS